MQLPMLLLAYRTSVQETTGVTPFSVTFGRSARFPIDIEFDLPYASYESPKQYGRVLHQCLQESYATVCEHSSAEQSRQERLYDRSIYGLQYEIGDEVWLHCPAVPKGRCRKFHRPWQGPFTVVKLIDNYVYRIQSNNTPRKRLVVHYSRLKPYHQPFNTDVFGPDCNLRSESSPTQQSSIDSSGEPKPQELGTETTGDCSEAPEVFEQRNTQQDSTPSPRLRHSNRMRRPLDRYGQGIYSDSDSDSWRKDTSAPFGGGVV
jgi:hypothetical protein